MKHSDNIHELALSKSIRLDKLTHAYIVYGGNDEVRASYIKEIIKKIFCSDKQNAPCGQCINCRKVENGNMEDVITVERDGNSIKVEQIKMLTAALGNKPFTERTVALINNSDLMTPESQNKLLKSLEEPAPGTVIILNTANLFSLFPTIRSRCVAVKIGDRISYTDSVLDERAANIVKYSLMGKPLNSIFNEVSECVKCQTDADDLLEVMEVFVRDMIVFKYEPTLIFEESHRVKAERINWDKGYNFKEYLRYIETARGNLKKGLNWKYCLKDLIIHFKQEESYG